MSNKTVVIMQPGYLPWLGFFELMSQSDVFVVYDNVQYDKNGWRNRNRIKTPKGPAWLTVPVTLPNGLNTKINEVRTAEEPWAQKHIRLIESHYQKAPFFKEYWPPIKKSLEFHHNKKDNSLLEVNMNLIKCLANILGLKKDIILASQLNVSEPDKLKRLVTMVKNLGGDRFYEPAGGKSYIGAKEISEFSKAGIKFEFQDYQHPTHRQLHGEFTPNLSVIDLVFNEGPKSLDIITGRI